MDPPELASEPPPGYAPRGEIQASVLEEQWSGRFFGHNRLRSKCLQDYRLHVDILQFSFIKLGYILQSPLKWSVIFLQSWTPTSYFSISTGSSVTNCLNVSILVLMYQYWLNNINLNILEELNMLTNFMVYERVYSSPSFVWRVWETPKNRIIEVPSSH